jgi:hypothetical protein
VSERRNRTFRDDPWLPEFVELMQIHSAMRFQWGVHDCATVAAKVVSLRSTLSIPAWTNARSALKLTREKPLLDRVREILGEPIVWGDCIIGDIAIAKNEDDRMPEVLAVFDGSGFIVPTHRGFARIFEGDVICGWSP